MLFIAGTNIKKRKKIHKVFSGKSESNIRKSSEGILKAERNTRIIVRNISINPPVFSPYHSSSKLGAAHLA